MTKVISKGMEQVLGGTTARTVTTISDNGCDMIPVNGPFGNRTYGPRTVIVPADPITWDEYTSYEYLTLVADSGWNSYISKKDVPAGTPLSDEEFWIPGPKFNAQLSEIQDYISEINKMIEGINENIEAISSVQGGYPSATIGISPYNFNYGTISAHISAAIDSGVREFILCVDLSETDNSIQNMSIDDYVNAAELIYSGGGDIFAVNFHLGNVNDLSSYQSSVEKVMGALTKYVSTAIVFNERDKIFDNLNASVNMINNLKGQGLTVGVSTNYKMWINQSVDTLYNACDYIGFNLYPWAGTHASNLDEISIRNNMSANMYLHHVIDIMGKYAPKCYVNEVGVRGYFEYYVSPSSYSYDGGLKSNPRAQTLYLKAFMDIIGTKVDKVFAWYDPTSNAENTEFFKKYTGGK